MHNIAKGTWVVVADGAGARVFTNIGDEKAISLRQDDLLSQDDTEGGPGKVPQEQNDADMGESAFSHQLAHRINAAALKNQFQHLVLIADPQSLGRIRPLLHKVVQERLLGELGKTLTNAPLADIERALS